MSSSLLGKSFDYIKKAEIIYNLTPVNMLIGSLAMLETYAFNMLSKFFNDLSSFRRFFVIKGHRIV